MFSDTGTQTEWKYPRNANTQYYAREFSEAEQEEKFKSGDVSEFIGGVCPR